jgi:hypothetical protein
VTPAGWDDDGERDGGGHGYAGDLDDDHVEDDDLEDDGVGEELGGLGPDIGVNRAPICGFCGVTALAADPANVIDTAFVCDNEDCEAYRDVIG